MALEVITHADRPGYAETVRSGRIHDDAPWLFLYGARLGWALAPEAAAWRQTPDGLIAFEAQTRSAS